MFEEKKQLLDEEGRDYLNRIIKASQKMEELINDLLSLAFASREEIICKDIEFNTIIRDIVNEFQQSSPDRNVIFKIEESIIAKADPKLIRIALQNLISNAWKYTKNLQKSVIEIGVIPDETPKIYFTLEEN